MIIDVSIDSAAVYSSMYISEIYIEYYKNASSATMPGKQAYRVYMNSNSDSSVKRQRIVVNSSQLSDVNIGTDTFSSGLFYVIVKCGGSLPPQIANYPCGADNTVRIGVSLDWRKVYERGMGFVSSLLDSCGNPCQSTSEFEHFILIWNALKLAISACDWDAVSDLWDKFNRTPSTTSIASSGCGCH